MVEGTPEREIRELKTVLQGKGEASGMEKWTKRRQEKEQLTIQSQRPAGEIRIHGDGPTRSTRFDLRSPHNQ